MDIDDYVNGLIKENENLKNTIEFLKNEEKTQNLKYRNIDNKTLEQITQENTILLTNNEKIRHIIEEINIIHYFHPSNIQDAIVLNKKLISENLSLREKLHDIYDI